MSANRINVHISRSDTGVPWGFRIAGGRDFGAPVSVQRVVPGGVAERAGLCAGDALTEIGGASAASMTHREAQQAIKAAGNSLALAVVRGSAAKTPAVATTRRDSAQHPVNSLTGALRSLSVQGESLEERDGDEGDGEGYRSGVNSTAQPWRPSGPSVDAGVALSSSQGPTTSLDFGPSNDSPSASLSFGHSGPSGFRSISATLPVRGDNASAESASLPPPATSEHHYASGPKPFQASVSLPPAHQPQDAPQKPPRAVPVSRGIGNNNGNGSAVPQPVQHQYQPSRELMAAISDEAGEGPGTQGRVRPGNASSAYRYQPTSEFGQRASDPSITPMRQEQDLPSWRRKVSDTGPSGSRPIVAPKPPADRRLSLERPQKPDTPPKGPSPPPPPPSTTFPLPAQLSRQTKETPAPKSQPPGVCFHCKETIRGPYLMALDRVYCTDHFRCVKCEVKLDKQHFIVHEDDVYCVDDYAKYCAPKCAKCKEPVVTEHLKAMGQVYHPNCFVCNMCQQPIPGGSFQLGTDNLPYCEADWKANFQVICSRCDFPLQPDERFIEALGKSFHAECFVCTTCHTKLEGKPFYNRNDHPYCRDHIKQ